MGFYGDVILPHLIDLTCGMKDLVPEREKMARDLKGTVLEIGFGSGLNLPHYPVTVTRILGVDPSERARKIARHRIEKLHCPIEFVGLDAERIAADDASVDTALSTFTLCTIPDAGRALAEVKRILKPGGTLHFLEHGRAKDSNVAKWQDRLNGVQQFLCGGCNVNRDMRELVESAGFRMKSLEADYFPKMPRTHGFLYRGVATA